MPRTISSIERNIFSKIENIIQIQQVGRVINIIIELLLLHKQTCLILPDIL